MYLFSPVLHISVTGIVRVRYGSPAGSLTYLNYFSFLLFHFSFYNILLCTFFIFCCQFMFTLVNFCFNFHKKFNFVFKFCFWVSFHFSFIVWILHTVNKLKKKQANKQNKQTNQNKSELKLKSKPKPKKPVKQTEEADAVDYHALLSVCITRRLIHDTDLLLKVFPNFLSFL